MPTGYATVEDVRRVFQKSDFSGALESADNEIVVDAITALTEPVEKATDRHWYESDGITEDDHGLIPTAPKSRDDEEDIPTGGAFVVGEPVTPKTWQGTYTRIELARRHAETISQLLVLTPDGYEDWTTEYSGGTWPDAVGDDYYLRVNNGGVSHLYIDSENLLDEDGEPLIDSYSNAVYVTYEYGHEGIPKNVRRGVALLVASELVLEDDLVTAIPDDGQLIGVETKAQRWGRQGVQKLEPYLEEPSYLEAYQ